MVIKTKTIQSDVLVIGGGLAGAWAAIRAREKGRDVLWVDKAEPGKCGQSVFAAGDYDILPPGEDIEDLTQKWMGTRLHSKKLMHEFLAQSWDRILEMVGWGIEFEKDEKGNYEIHTAHGGHRRVVSESYTVQRKLRKVAKDKGVKILGRTYVSDLLTTKGETRGAVGFNVRTGERYKLKAKSVVMAAGPYGVRANNFQGVGFLSGDSLAMAFRAGGELYNTEFLRGNVGHVDYNTVGMARFTGSFGGRVMNAKGEYFLQQAVPDNSKLAVAMAKEVKEGRGPIYFDLTTITPEQYTLSRKVLPHLFRTLDRAGVDIRKEPMPWMPVGYRSAGGLVYDYDFHTTLKGLYVAGDATGGGSLSWAMFTGCRAGEKAGEYAAKAASDIDDKQAEELLKETFTPGERKGGLTPDQVIYEIQEIVVPYPVLILKSEETLNQALASIRKVIVQDVPKIYAVDSHQLMKANEARNMALGTEIAIRASLMRKESRGGFFREDYPMQNDNEWLKWISVKKDDGKIALNLKPVLP